MPTFYKKQPDGSVDQVELPESEQARALASGYTLTDPTPPKMPAKAPPDVVNTDYFNNLLDVTEQQYSQKRGATEQSYQTFIDQLKTGRELFNADLEGEYGKALEDMNVNVYSRGVEDSGIKGRKATEIAGAKESAVLEKDILDKQKAEIADQERQQKLADLSLGEREAKLRIGRQASSPYTDYSYTA